MSAAEYGYRHDHSFLLHLADLGLVPRYDAPPGPAQQHDDHCHFTWLGLDWTLAELERQPNGHERWLLRRVDAGNSSQYAVMGWHPRHHEHYAARAAKMLNQA